MKRRLSTIFASARALLVLKEPKTDTHAMPSVPVAERLPTEPTAHRRHIIEAMEVLRCEGVTSALKFLNGKPGVAPSGVEALFRAYAARSDAEWLEQTNAWLSHHSRHRVYLVNGPGPRFDRIRFAHQGVALEKGPKITVIVPVYNAEETIELALSSVLNQTWRNIEVIAVNDASSDRSGKILDAMAGNDPRLKVLHNPVNVGPYVSKNVGLDLATGAFVTGHDADDIAFPDRLERQVALFEEDSTRVGVIAQMLRVSREGLFNYPSGIGTGFSTDGVRRIAMISLMVRRESLNRVGYWDCVRFGGDNELYLRLSVAYGDRVQKHDILSMLCLNEPGSLTNNSISGISATHGTSEVRKVYRAKFVEWHANFSHRRVPYREFSNSNRPFSVPNALMVPEKDIRVVRKAHGCIEKAQG